MSVAETNFSLARDSLQAREPSARLGRFRRRGYQRYRLLRSSIDLEFVWKRRWFIITMIVGFSLMSAPTPAGLSHQAQIVLCMSIMATMLFISEAVPLPTVPLLIIVGEVVLLKVDATKVAQSLMTDSVLFIMGSLMLAVAIVKQRLDKRIAWWIVRVTGTNVYWISFGITTVCGVLAAFIGEHTVAAMMLPVGVTLITLTSNDPKKVHNLAAVILFSISYGCSIAGVATPSGGARNAIIISYWKDFFYDPTDPATRRFDQELAMEPALKLFASASRRVGRAQLKRLRPLRDHRLLQRYLRTMDDGVANAWHTLVYGLTLSVYSLPVLQGLTSYEKQTLLGFMHAVSRTLRLSETDCRNLLDQLSPSLPNATEPILGEEHSPRCHLSF